MNQARRVAELASRLSTTMKKRKRERNEKKDEVKVFDWWVILTRMHLKPTGILPVPD